MASTVFLCERVGAAGLLGIMHVPMAQPSAAPEFCSRRCRCCPRRPATATAQSYGIKVGYGAGNAGGFTVKPGGEEPKKSSSCC